MDFRVIWSPEAIEDLDSIAAYIERDSIRYAGAVVDRILERGRALESLPRSGRVVPEIGDPNIRECIVYSYRMIYQIQSHEILIVAIAHGNQLLEGFEDRLKDE